MSDEEESPVPANNFLEFYTQININSIVRPGEVVTVLPAGEISNASWFDVLLGLKPEAPNTWSDNKVEDPGDGSVPKDPGDIVHLDRDAEVHLPGFGSTESVPRFEEPNDEPALQLTLALAKVSRLLGTFLTSARHALDLLTFPTSHTYEALGRLRGTFWVISQTLRCINSAYHTDEPADLEAFKTYIREEMKEFLKHNRAFGSGLDNLLESLKKSFGILDKKMLSVKKIEKEYRLDILKVGVKGGVFIGPIYSTDLDAREVAYYEDLMCQDKDVDESSLNLIWTDSHVFFKQFTSPDWLCLNQIPPRIQMKILISLTNDVRSIYYQVQSHLEASINTFTTELKEVNLESPLVKARAGSVGNTHLFRLKSDLQKVVTTRARVNQVLEELRSSMDWIQSVAKDVAAMAPLERDELQDSYWVVRGSRPGIMRYLCFCCCVKSLDPFFAVDYDAVRLRLTVSHELLTLLQETIPVESDSVSTSNFVESLITQMNFRDFNNFTQKQKAELDELERIRSEGSDHFGITQFNTNYLTRICAQEGTKEINVYTVGHEERDRT